MIWGWGNYFHFLICTSKFSVFSFYLDYFFLPLHYCTYILTLWFSKFTFYVTLISKTGCFSVFSFLPARNLCCRLQIQSLTLKAFSPCNINQQAILTPSKQTRTTLHPLGRDYHNINAGNTTTGHIHVLNFLQNVFKVRYIILSFSTKYQGNEMAFLIYLLSDSLESDYTLW